MQAEKKFRVRKTDDPFNTWTVADGDCWTNSSQYIIKGGEISTVCEAINTEAEAQAALDLYLQNLAKVNTFIAEMGCKPTNPKDALGIKKAPLSTLPTGPAYEVALAMLEGARKYGRHNYRVMGVRASVYYDAAMRHLTTFWEGEDIDPDSGIHHLMKAAACLFVLRDSMFMENWVDDRPPQYPQKLDMASLNDKAGEVLKKYPDCVEPYTEESVRYNAAIDHETGETNESN